MRKITAHFIFNGYQYLQNTALIIDSDGTIIDIISIDKTQETSDLEFYNGILCPGFINAHCHLELSFLKNKLTPHTKLDGFIQQMRGIDRTLINNTILDQLNNADRYLYKQGVSVCADIVNTSLTSYIKKKSFITYRNFIELYSVNETENVESLIENAVQLGSLFDNFSLTPHAPYSVFEQLLKGIINQSKSTFFSIHFKESDKEKELFFKFQNSFKLKLKNDNDPSIFFISYFPKNKTVFFVHNTYLSESELDFIVNNFDDPYFVLCPNSNLFIENRLPPKHLIDRCSKRICIGTDSLASNSDLSVIEEIKTLSLQFPDISLSQWLSMATIQGAKALKLSETFGSFEKGKKPGIVLIENVNLKTLRLTSDSCSRRL